MYTGTEQDAVKITSTTQQNSRERKELLKNLVFQVLT